MPTFFTSSEFLSIVFMVALGGLVLAILADHLQIIAKYVGSQNRRIAGGYNLAMKVMMVNRLGAVLYFMLLAFSIESGLSETKLALGLSLSVAIIALPTVGILVWLKRRLNGQGIDYRFLDARAWPLTIVISTFVATVLNLLGLTVPWIASATYPELRLTLANTSFLFNTLFTAINVFYIENKLAQMVDQDTDNIHGFLSGVMFGRLMAFALVAIGLLTIV